jgi:hypothetical protein
MLAETAYGKSSVRLVKVSRHGDRHDLKDLTVAIRFEGEYDQSYTDGDNRDVLPTAVPRVGRRGHRQWRKPELRGLTRRSFPNRRPM